MGPINDLQDLGTKHQLRGIAEQETGSVAN